MIGATVIDKGLSASIQDLGRFRHQIEGFPTSGAIDQAAFCLANGLVNNPVNAAAIEFCLLGPSLKFHCRTFIAITGAVCPVFINAQLAEENQVLEIFENDVLTFGPVTRGRYGYIAFAAGGLLTVPVLDSRSTTLRAGIGGLDRHLLQKGDQLPLNECYQMPSLQSRQYAVDEKKVVTGIRVVKGPQWSLFDPAAQENLVKQTFTVSTQADRMGYRLTEKLLPAAQVSLLSEGTVFGNIQITRNGQPIVLLADRQTTGGYPVIATIIAADFSAFVQMPLGQKFAFTLVDLPKAQQELLVRRQRFKRLLASWQQARYQFPIGPARKAAVKIQALLASENEGD
ncbi:biotin-dependent carboxyltransferase family protein [Oenococcus kitaharae]|uniref:Allophanate hydrolase 2 subunit 2 n=1 Tax=Oenococcus kitaharae DSM 17330 TaxID=1045004 RepID=G9WFM3_9LACO|nr:biotin-dependent carboxyltransferase family protein [Oenococcus kitaharae]EHN59315.1 Allophanate hydrolase 2 subunit 2 [Oenococcus kitaharae DSM 17330]OEY82165.1 allophanate hydrolase [Oenococcus kitaharae]OEY82588.1 allophanate hydrolase [Oenococcus kitaharae]OEY84844.1 allophanate hydrolase [Oenococcus kitaharae]